MRSGSVKHFHNSSRGASNSRVMTKSFVFASMAVMVLAPLIARLSPDQNHPADAEFVGQHAKARREECLRQRHVHFAAFGQRAEDAFGVGISRGAERQCNAMK